MASDASAQETLAALHKLAGAEAILTPEQCTALAAHADALCVHVPLQNLHAEGAAAACFKNGTSVPRPVSMLPECHESWLPPELMFEVSYLQIFGLSPPPDDEALGAAPSMPDLEAPALGRTPFERSLHPRVAAALRGRLTWGWDLFELAAACVAAGPSCPGPLVCLGAVVFVDHGLADAFAIPEPVLLAFFAGVQAAYLAMPYHNALHAADVLHSLNYILVAGGMQRCLNPMEVMAALLSAAVHDVAHPGVTSAFLTAAGTPLALRYNDTHVLENYHACTAFAIMARPGCNLAANMAAADARALRRQIIALVLATDMADHGAFMAEAARRLSAAGGLSMADSAADRDLALRLALKCADISNAAKPVASAVRWGVAILTELFRQGDLERARGMAVSPLCDRATVSVASAQLSFLEHVATPLYTALGVLSPCMAASAVARTTRTSAFYAAQTAREDGQAAFAAEP